MPDPSSTRMLDTATLRVQLGRLQTLGTDRVAFRLPEVAAICDELDAARQAIREGSDVILEARAALVDARSIAKRNSPRRARLDVIVEKIDRLMDPGPAAVPTPEEAARSRLILPARARRA
jgi:hypothetical protein